MKIGRLIAAAAGVAVLASTMALTGCSNDNEKYVNVYTVEGGNPLGRLSYSNEGGSISVYDLELSTLGVMFPDELDGEPVVAISGSALSSDSGITVAVLPDSMVKVSDGAFTSMSKVYCSNPDNIQAGSAAFTGGMWFSTGFTDDGSIHFCDGEYSYTETEGGIEITGFKPMADLLFPDELNGAVSIEDYAFCNNGILTSISNIPQAVTRIGDRAFYNCSNLRSVTFAGESAEEGVANLSTVTEVGDWAFGGCENLTAVRMSDDMMTIGEGAFSRCSFTDVSIPASVTSIGTYAFDNCGDLQNISIAEGNRKYVDVDGVLYTLNQKEVLKFPEGRTGTYEIPYGVQTIGVAAFRGCGDYQVVVPKSVKYIDNRAFIGNGDKKNNQPTKIYMPASAEVDTPVLSNMLTVDFPTFNSLRG